MRQLGFTLQERQLVALLKWWTGLFGAAALGFAFFGEQIIYWLNTIGHIIFKWPYRTLPYPVEDFWRILATSLLVVLAVISFDAARDVRQYLNNVKLIIISKFISTVGFISATILAGPYFPYVAGAVIDGLILFITWYFYYKTCDSRAL